MEKRHDYIPQNAAQFGAFMQRLLDYLLENFQSWGIPQARVTELNTLHTAFYEAMENAITTPAHPQILARQEAQAALTQALRSFVNQFLRFPPVTNVDRAEMGIPNHDTIRTDHTVVTEKVDFVIHVNTIRELSIDFWQQGKDHKAKPESYDGAVIIWGIRDTAPEHPDNLDHHLMASRRPFILHFEEEQRGKTVQIALCWQNERGIRGEWSEYKSAIVP